MVVGLALAAIQMGMALPTGFLFGVGYGTGVRIGYEQVYPLLFPKGARSTTSELAATMKGMNTVYDAIGGKDASRMGIAVGITNAGEILNNPDFQVLEKLELSSSGPTSSSSNRTRYGLDQESALEALSSDIEQFNEDNPNDVEKLDRYRGYTITQLRNIIISTTNAQSKRLATQVINEKLQEDQGTGESTSVTTEYIPPPPSKLTLEAKKPVALAWFKKRDEQINIIHQEQAKVRSSRGFNERAAHQQKTIMKQQLRRSNRYINAKSTIIRMSRDYRHPNNAIRTQALILRKLLPQL